MCDIKFVYAVPKLGFKSVFALTAGDQKCNIVEFKSTSIHFDLNLRSLGFIALCETKCRETKGKVSYFGEMSLHFVLRKTVQNGKLLLCGVKTYACDNALEPESHANQTRRVLLA